MNQAQRMMKVERLSWSQLDERLEGLKRKIEKYGTPDAIVGVARNGLILTAMLSIKLGVEDFYSLRICFRLFQDVPKSP